VTRADRRVSSTRKDPDDRARRLTGAPIAVPPRPCTQPKGNPFRRSETTVRKSRSNFQSRIGRKNTDTALKAVVMSSVGAGEQDTRRRGSR
jgi:hypothetical protein